ncbi:MAG TPA: PEGA domain-containing protein [Myxococcales bacterium]|nr:PEGA domain-containing protein [Myxococcales bacterium]
MRSAWVGLPFVLAACATAQRPAAQPVSSAPPRPVATPSAPPQASPSPGSGIRFFVDPPDAEVLVNGRDLGSVARLGADGSLRLTPGIYRVTLRHPGFETWRAEVAVRGAFERIQVQLVKQTP